MSAVLGVLVTQNGSEVRLDFGADARDEYRASAIDGDGTERVFYVWSEGMKKDLASEWSGAADPELDPEGWWLTFHLRPAVTLDDALEAFIAIYAARRQSYKHLIVHR